MDRRVRRTRKMLSRALLELIKEKDYESITIQDITEQADVHRATFYLHFTTKEELLATSLESLFADLGTRAKAESGVEKPSFLKETEAGRVIFAHVSEYSDLYRVLVGQKGVGYVTHHIINYMTTVFEEKLRNDFPEESEFSIPRVIIARHLSGSIYSLLTWWLENDMPYDTDMMASFANDLGRQGVLQILGVQEN
jgi:AcrR family transcriptional regulator